MCDLMPVKDNSWGREVRISAPQTSTMLFTEPQLKNLRQLRLGWLCPSAGHMASYKKLVCLLKKHYRAES